MATDKKTPVASFGPYSSGGGSTIELSIWENTIKVQNGEKEAKVYAVSFSRNYREGEEWKKTKNLRLQDISILQYCLRKAEEWMREKKSE